MFLLSENNVLTFQRDIIAAQYQAQAKSALAEATNAEAVTAALAALPCSAVTGLKSETFDTLDTASTAAAAIISVMLCFNKLF